MDQPGIIQLDSGHVDLYDPFSLSTKENAEIIKTELKRACKHLNSEFRRQDQPFQVKPHFAGKSQDELCSDGLATYLKSYRNGKPPIFMTSAIAASVVEALAVFRSKIRGLAKSIINIEKDAQGGKTPDIQNNSTIISICNYLETGVFTVPLILLMSKNNHEDQLEEDWRIRSAFFNIMEITCTKNHESRAISSYISKWNEDNPCFWIRRVGGQTVQEKWRQFFCPKLQKGWHILVSFDEADVGLRANSVTDRLFGNAIHGTKSLYDLIQSGKNNSVTILNHSATLSPLTRLGDFVVNIKAKTDNGYGRWLQKDRIGLTQASIQYKCPGFAKTGSTISYKHGPFYDKSAFLKLCCHLQDNKITMKLDDSPPSDSWTKEELSLACKNKTVDSWWKSYREKFIPEKLAQFFRHRLIKHNGTDPRPIKGLTIRYTNNNAHALEIIQLVRRHLPDDEIIIIPYMGAIDPLNGVNYVEAYGTFTDAVEGAYRMRGMEYGDIPYVAFWTGEGRRGLRTPNDSCQIEFGFSPTTQTSMEQACGRIGGYNKDNVQLIVNDAYLEEIEKYAIGDSRLKPNVYVSGGAGKGRPRRGIELRLSDISGHKTLEKMFAAINNIVLNTEEQLRECHLSDKAIIRGGGNFWKRPLCIFEIITEDCMRYIEDNSTQIFPGLESFTLLRPGDVNERGEIYDTCLVGSKTVHPAGFRHGDMTTNMGHKNKAKLQPQIHFEYNKRKRKMSCIMIGLWLEKEARRVTSMKLLPNSVPAKCASVDEQESLL